MRRTLPALKLFGKKVILPTEAAEFALLDRAITDMALLEDLPNVTSHSHPLASIRQQVKPPLSIITTPALSSSSSIAPIQAQLQHVQQILSQECTSYHEKIQGKLFLTKEEEEAAGLAWQQDKETYFRLLLSQSYFKSMETLVNREEVNVEVMSSRMRRLVDSVLVGTSSERLQGKYTSFLLLYITISNHYVIYITKLDR